MSAAINASQSTGRLAFGCIPKANALMTKLLYVVNIPRFFVSHRLPLALAARAAGYEVHVATSDADTENVRRIQAAGLPFHPLPLAQHGTNPLAELRVLRTLYHLYTTLQPDLVHHVTIKPVIYGGLMARLARVPAVVHMLTGLGYVFIDPGRKAALIRMLAKPAYRLALAHPNARLILQNPDDRQVFIANRLIPAEKTVLVRGSGVDVQQFTPQPEPQGTPVVLFAGRLLRQKGLPALVDAARQLHAAGVPLRCVIVGYPEPSNPYAVVPEQLEAWQREGVIEWWGKRDDMPAVYAQANIVCLPSQYGEGVPKVLIEAAACGRALVTTDIPGCREVVQHGANGLLVPPGDTAALVSALHTLLTDPAKRQQMGARGRQLAEQEFALDLILEQTFAVYRTLLDSVQAASPQQPS